MSSRAPDAHKATPTATTRRDTPVCSKAGPTAPRRLSPIVVTACARAPCLPHAHTPHALTRARRSGAEKQSRASRAPNFRGGTRAARPASPSDGSRRALPSPVSTPAVQPPAHRRTNKNPQIKRTRLRPPRRHARARPETTQPRHITTRVEAAHVDRGAGAQLRVSLGWRFGGQTTQQQPDRRRGVVNDRCSCCPSRACSLCALARARARPFFLARARATSSSRHRPTPALCIFWAKRPSTRWSLPLAIFSGGAVCLRLRRRVRRASRSRMGLFCRRRSPLALVLSPRGLTRATKAADPIKVPARAAVDAGGAPAAAPVARAALSASDSSAPRPVRRAEGGVARALCF